MAQEGVMLGVLGPEHNGFPLLFLPLYPFPLLQQGSSRVYSPSAASALLLQVFFPFTVLLFFFLPPLPVQHFPPFLKYVF